jgi:hypothetical protein
MSSSSSLRGVAVAVGVTVALGVVVAAGDGLGVCAVALNAMATEQRKISNVFFMVGRLQ